MNATRTNAFRLLCNDYAIPFHACIVFVVACIRIVFPCRQTVKVSERIAFRSALRMQVPACEMRTVVTQCADATPADATFTWDRQPVPCDTDHVTTATTATTATTTATTTCPECGWESTVEPCECCGTVPVAPVTPVKPVKARKPRKGEKQAAQTVATESLPGFVPGYFAPDRFDKLTYRELQAVAKGHGIRANQKREEIVAALLAAGAAAV